MEKDKWGLTEIAQVSQSRNAVPRCTERCRSERSAALSYIEMSKCRKAVRWLRNLS